LLDRPWRALASHARALSSDPTDEELHRVRIETKRVRYAAEAVVPVIGKRAAKFARSAEALQEVLGEHQDAVTAMRWLEGHGTRTADPAVAFTSGRLAQLEAADRARSRTAWPDAWRSLARRKRFWI
jgi:CHAD domain-containing protein